MTRFLFAAVLVAALGSSAVAADPVPQMPEPVQPVLPPPPPPALYHPDVYVPPGAPPGPAIPFHKSGGIVVGAYGFYPYDTGHWLLAEGYGTTRQSGAFTMVYPGVFPASAAPRTHWFGKRGQCPR
jgi:hypothetical protein